MTLQSSGAISINDLVGEYGGSAPHSLNEYYRGGSLVANHSNNGNVPTSGTIQLDDFYGANNTAPGPSSYNYSASFALGILNTGYNSEDSPFPGSWSPSSQSPAFSTGFNPNVTIFQTETFKSSTTFTFRCVGALPNSGWTSVQIPSNMHSGSGTLTLNRSSMNHSQGTFTGGTRTTWSLSLSQTFTNATSGTIVINK